MILTLNPVTVGGARSLPEFVALAQKHGFGGVEFGIEEAARLCREQSPEAVRALFETAGVVPAVFGLPVEWRRDDAVFEEGIKALPVLAETAQAIGCERCCTWLPPSVNEDPTRFRNSARFRFREVAGILGDYGIRFGLEWVGPYTLRHGPGAMGKHDFIYTMPGALELIEDIDAASDNVGLLVDTFHWFTTGATVQDLEGLTPAQIVHVHLNDAPDRPRDEQMDKERLLPGEGVIDLHGFLRALKTVGYDGPLAAEVFSEDLPKRGQDEAARLTMASMQSVMAGA